MTQKRRKRHSPEQIVRKLRDADAMLNAGKNYFQRAPQLMIYPGVMISLTVMGFNLLADALQDALDTRRLLT